MSKGDADSDVIIHAAPTDWINPPKFDARLASQIARNTGMEKGEAGLAEDVSDTGFMKRNPALTSNS
ncbi:hypothetical protein [Sphingobium lactosutens]|uniref:hypothetical protein n=1 Tax=Sphingobium lactosutens TaxID=522773 RepID=UPI001F2BDAD8|nr:hypothetical protein [Sphingobium lactosutens]